MKALAPRLFDRRFRDLVEIGRSQLPGLAPGWTDHNLHDPGITLLELLAWVTEAQLYAVGRMRRDERAAYGALFEVLPEGARPARGLLWRDRADALSPFASPSRSRVIERDAAIHLEDDGAPVFRPLHRQLWVPGRIIDLHTKSSRGETRDHRSANERDGAGFEPFTDPGDTLVMRFATGSHGGLFPKDRDEARGARLVLGLRTATAIRADAAAEEAPRDSCGARVEVTLRAGDAVWPLPVVEDTTSGLAATGALVLDIDGVTASPQEFTLELRAPDLARSPRWLRFEPHAVPFTQESPVDNELQVATGEPGFGFELARGSLAFAAGAEPVSLRVSDARGTKTWSRCGRLRDQGPGDASFELDLGRGRITFGNGVNGMLPARDAEVRASYRVCDGAAGNVARNRRWKVQGFAGAFGVNLDPVAGGRDRADPGAMRREARRRARERDALVSARDITEAARALPLLQVSRAWIANRPSPSAHGTITLVAMRAREPGDLEPESPRWLRAVQRALAPRMPLGTRLAVAAPAYARFRLRGTVAVEAGRDLDAVGAAVRAALRERLRLVDTVAGAGLRAAGVPLNPRDVIAWIRGVEGVSRVESLEFIAANGRAVGEIAVAPDGLPLHDDAASEIAMRRLASGGRRG